jgi:hypothetical protein
MQTRHQRRAFLIVLVACWWVLFLGLEGARGVLLQLTAVAAVAAWVLASNHRRRVAEARERRLHRSVAQPHHCVVLGRLGAPAQQERYRVET